MTLVEVLAVVVILGLLAGTLMVGFSGSYGKARHELAKSGIGIIMGRLELYKLDKGRWPDAGAGLAALSEPQAAPTDSYYLSPDQLLDPWGKTYEYVSPGAGGHPYEVLSLGGDGLLGGEAEDADVSSLRLREKERGS
jgi:general secretion pathway protein G